MRLDKKTIKQEMQRVGRRNVRGKEKGDKDREKGK